MSENLSKTQLLWLVISFNLGSAILLTPGIITNTAKQDSWVALIIGSLLSTITLITISKLSYLHPKLSFVQYSEIIIGKFFGKIIGILWCWFALHLGALVFRNFSDFFIVTMLPDTPDLVIYFVMIVPITLVLLSGVNVIGYLAQVISPVVLIFFVGVTLSMISNFDIQRILPSFQTDIKHIAWGSIQVLSFPFGESVLFASLLVYVKDKKDCSKVLIKGVFIAAALLLLGIVRTLLALGLDETQRLYYAVLEPARRSVLQGIEVLIVINWFNFAFFKITVCMFVFCKGFADLVGSNNYKIYIIPTGIIMIFLSKISFDNIGQALYAARYFWPVFAIPIEIIMPLLLLSVSMIKNKKSASNNN